MTDTSDYERRNAVAIDSLRSLLKRSLATWESAWESTWESAQQAWGEWPCVPGKGSADDLVEALQRHL
jgi:hypothetical protein